jgi:hypothetical protein
MITTKQPSDDMIEVAIVSMEEALAADGAAVPGGSTDFEREPMALGVAAATATVEAQPAPPAPVSPGAPTATADPPPGA